MHLSGKSFIGARRGESGGPSFRATDPAEDELLETQYFTASPEESDLAVRLADAAAPVYARISGKARAAFLRTIADEIEAIADEIAALGPRETGLPEARLRGETGRTTGQLRMFASLVEEGSWADARIDRAQPDRQPLPKPDIRSMLRPLGPVVVFGAGNFPLAFSVAGGDTASALASGCPVIVKAHPSHPGLSEMVGNAIRTAVEKSSLPEGVFSLLFDDGHEAGQLLAKHPLVKAIAFTGSRAGGMALMNIANARPEPIPVHAEMSSINPVVLLPDALEQRGAALAEGLFTSLTMGSGQFCTNPGLVFVAGENSEAFFDKLKNLISSSAPAVMLNAGIAEAYRKGTASVDGISGIDLLARCPSSGGRMQAAPVVYKTSVSGFLSDKRLHAEIFGPATLIVTGSIDEITAAIPHLEGQLTATIHASEKELSQNPRLIHAMENRAGRVLFNGFPTGVEVCPAIVHGGPFPATSDGRGSSVGTMAISRFCRPVAWQSFPDDVLPEELRDGNPLDLFRTVDGVLSRH